MDALLDLDDLIEDEENLEVEPPPSGPSGGGEGVTEGAPSPVAPPPLRLAALPPPAAPRSGGGDSAPPPRQPSRPSEGWAFQPVSQQRVGGFGASAGSGGVTRPQNVAERAASVAAEAARPDMTVEKFSGMRIRCASARRAQLPRARNRVCTRALSRRCTHCLHRSLPANRTPPPRRRRSARSGRVVGSIVVEERFRDMRVTRLPHIRCATHPACSTRWRSKRQRATLSFRRSGDFASARV
jgi:hypothetical protein